VKNDRPYLKEASEADVRALLANYKVDQQMGVDWLKPYGVLVFKCHSHPCYFIMLDKPMKKVHFEWTDFWWGAFSDKYNLRRHIAIFTNRSTSSYTLDFDFHSMLDDILTATFDNVRGIAIRGTQVRAMEF